MEEDTMTHDSATPNNSLFSPLPYKDIQFYSLQKKWENQMGTSRNVMKLIMRSSPFDVQKWRKDEIDLYTPSPTTHEKDLYIEKYYS